MQNQQKESIVIKYINAYNKKDIDEMLKYVTWDVAFSSMSEDKVNVEIFGKSNFQELMKSTQSLFRKRELIIKSIKFIEGKIWIDTRLEAVFATNLPNGIKKGDELKVDSSYEFTFRYKLLSHIAEYI
ncbi:MAG: hypothetical protein C0602_01145 [Denitrovibrio sp.]|nr:MAG: hypothetical protein C0602_01145 [Denitrovibrio sp.]